MPKPRFASKAAAVAQIAGLAVAAGALVAAVAIPAVGFAGMVTRDTAKNFNTMATPELGQIPVRSEMLDRHGKVLAYYYGRGIDRVPVSYAQISPAMRQAIVAIEDSRFYQHGAIDFKGTVRAIVNNLQHNPVQGGSTLSQQYVKNVLYLSSPNPQAAFAGATSETIGRKIRELRMAARVEHQMSKNQILAAYLNVAYFGSSAYGVEVAAERYFNTDASKLTLPQAALLAGLVENPTAYDPINNPKTALARRNQVLQRMVQVGDITQSAADSAGRQPLGLNPTVLQKGCTSSSARYAGFFCDYVLASMKVDPEFKQAWQRLNGIGGLKIYTTLDPAVQRAARNAVNYMLPPPPSSVNPGKNAATEVIIQPGTGKVRAIAIDRPYGYGKHATVVNYAVGPQYNGGEGVQIGSTGKVYVMVTALEQGIPFGYSKNVGFSADVGGYTNCKGQPTAPWQVHNDESEKGGHYTLYTGTTFSINVFFAYLEQKVGLCNVVKTAAKMGLTWPDGRSLLKRRPQGRPLAERGQPPVVHARRGQRRPDRRRGLRRRAARPRHLLPPDRRHQDRDHERRQAAGGVAEVPPGAVNRGRRRRQLHPPGRPHRRGDGAGRCHRPPGGGQDRDGGPVRLRLLRRLHAAPAGRGLGRQPGRPLQLPDEWLPRVLLPD